MKFTPYAYQQFAIQRIINHKSAGLFLDMGLGKTVITLTAIDELIYNHFEVEKVLVIAPLRVAEDTWSREAFKWDHLGRLRISKVLGSGDDRVRALNEEADIYIINRENVEWLVNRCGKKWPFDMVVVDELSSFKSPTAKRFRALRRVLPNIQRIVGLTGTPAPNGLIDLWSQIYLLDRGERLGTSVTGYRERYFNPGSYIRNGRNLIATSWVPKQFAEENIYDRLSDLCVSMKAADWLDMPERIDRTVNVTLPAEARAMYQQLEQDLVLTMIEAGSTIVAGTAAVLVNKLLQMANGAVYDDTGKARTFHDAKLDALADIIEAANGKPVLVFYAYKHDRERIQDYCVEKGIKGVKGLWDSKDIEDWNNGKIHVMLAHPASAGHGLNLQAGGNIIVWFGLTWSLEQYQQANARLHRQGQEHAVIVHHLVAEGTVDEDVMAALSNKVVGQEALLAAVKARIEKYERFEGESA